MVLHCSGVVIDRFGRSVPLSNLQPNSRLAFVETTRCDFVEMTEGVRSLT